MMAEPLDSFFRRRENNWRTTGAKTEDAMYDGTSEKGERCVGSPWGEGRRSEDRGLELGFDI